MSREGGLIGRLTVSLAFLATLVTSAHAGTVSLSATQDSWLHQDAPNSNKGGTAELNIKSELTKLRRAVVEFDVSAIPGTASIDCALLRLFITTNPGVETRMHDVNRLTSSWTENGVTWNNRMAATPWTTAGGDFVATPTASEATGTATGVFIEWDVTSDVAAFVSGSLTNYGWIVKDAVEGATNVTIAYASRENVNAFARPELVVGFDGGSCVPTATPSPTSTATDTPTVTETPVPTDTPTVTPTETEPPAGPTDTPEPTETATDTPTGPSATPSETSTPGGPTSTSTVTPTPTIPGPSATPTISPTPRPPICEETPAIGCRRPLVANKRTLFVKRDPAKPEKTRFTYEWRRGDAIPGDFGEPDVDNGTALNFCVYHGPQRLAVMGFDILPGGICDGKPCWKKRTSGIGLTSFKYRNRNKDGAAGPGPGNEAGVSKTRLSEGLSGQPPDARMIVKAKGVKVPSENLPAGAGGTMFDLPVLVQVQAHDADTGMILPVCWESEFSTAGKNSDKKFKALNDPPAP